MLHTPLSEDQANNERQAMFDEFKSPFIVGECDFDVYKCEEQTKTDKHGNNIQQFAFSLSCFDRDGNRALINCWIEETVKWKLREFYTSINRMDLYNKGELDADLLVGCSGKLICFNKDVKKDGDTRTYINVKKFLAPEVLTQSKSNDASSDMKDDDVPF